MRNSRLNDKIRELIEVFNSFAEELIRDEKFDELSLLIESAQSDISVCKKITHDPIELNFIYLLSAEILNYQITLQVNSDKRSINHEDFLNELRKSLHSPFLEKQ